MATAEFPAQLHRTLMWVIIVAVILAVSVLWSYQRRLENHNMVVGALTVLDVPQILTDSHGDITFCNTKTMEFLGGTILPDIWGHNITEFMCPKLRKRHRYRFDDAQAMPLGQIIMVDTAFMVDEVRKPIHLVVMAGEADGKRIYRISFTPRVEEK